MISELSVEEQIEYIHRLDLTDTEKTKLINDLNPTAEERAKIIDKYKRRLLI